MMLPESVRTCLSFAVLQRRLEQREAEYKNFQYILDEVRSILSTATDAKRQLPSHFVFA